MMETREFDIVVVGAGSTGAAAALWLREAGYRVALVESRARHEAGARWVNGIAPGLLEQAGLTTLRAPMRRGGQKRFVMTDRHGDHARDVGTFPLVNLDMRLLVRHFSHAAELAGVAIFDYTQPLEFEATGERPTGLRLCERRPEREPREWLVRAKLFVDASGFGAVLRKRWPRLARSCPPVAPADLCLASMQVREIADTASARAFLAEHGLAAHDVVSFTGVDGGWSMLMLEMNPRLGVMEFVSGAIGDGTHASGEALIERFAAEHPFVGPLLFGGGGPIPLRRPYDRFAVPGLVLAGTSACQVFTANASGVGAGLVAARLLAATLPRYADPGSAEATWAYQAAWMREWGGRFAAYDQIRRASAALTSEEMERLWAAGLITAEDTRRTMAHELPQPSLAQAKRLAPGALKVPRLAWRFLQSVARMPAVAEVYAHYPETPSEALLKGWAELRALADGTPSDLR